MTELETIQRAKMYIDKLANGINPLDDTVVPENDTINNVRLSRCLFYVSDVLRQVIENGGVVKAKSKQKEAFNITLEAIQKFQFSDKPIPVSKLADNINALVDTENMKKINHKHITDWLISLDMLAIHTRLDGSHTKRPTARGEEIGITTEYRKSKTGNEYVVTIYNRAAQQFIVDNIDAIISMMNTK